MNNYEKIVKVWVLSALTYVILFFAVVAILLLTGCVTSPEEKAKQNPLDLWQQGGTCVHLYYRQDDFAKADSGATCADGTLSEPVGHTRKLVADNCGESLFLIDYHVIYGCVGGHRSKTDTIKL